jgi:predicted chitinase
MKTMAANGITSPEEQAMFMAQMDHESGGFRKLSENLNYSPAQLMKTFPKKFASLEEAQAVVAGGKEAIANKIYGGRMGNTDDGDGAKYRGRGFIQLTGKDNYTQASKDLGIDLVGNPELAQDPETAAKIATWYWKKRNVGQAGQAGDVLGATKKINGGTIGLEDRQKKYEKYLADAKAGGLNPTEAVQVAQAQIAAVPTAPGLQDAVVQRDMQRTSTAAANVEPIRQAVASAAGGATTAPTDMTKLIELLAQIASNTGRAADNQLTPTALQQAMAGTQQVASNDPNGSNTNVFTLGNQGGRGGPRPMSDNMRRVVSG